MVSRFFITSLLVGYFAFFVPQASANYKSTQLDTFNFASCESLLGQSGDKAHFTTGMHQIVGGSVLSGSDDVYSLANNNFLQCFCPTEGNEGIQTNWLRSDYEIEGWFFVNGTDWNLDNYKYAARNISFNCHPLPTPAITPIPNSSTSFSAPQPCNGCGGVSTPVCDSKKPPAPTNFSVIRTGSTAKLSWTESTDTTHYSIVYGTQPGKYEYGVVNTGKTSTFTVGALDPGKKYYFSVNSVNNCMPSDPASAGQVLGLSTVKGLASTGGMSQIVALFAAGLISLILFAGVSKLISLCENCENIQILIEVAKEVASAVVDYSNYLLRVGDMVYVGKILQSDTAQLHCFATGDTNTTGYYYNVNRYRTKPPACPISLY